MDIARNAKCPCGSGLKHKRCCGRNARPQFQELVEPTLEPLHEDVVLLATPSRGSVSVETHQAVTSNTDGFPIVTFSVARKPVIEARNDLARAMLAHVKRLPFQARQFWCVWCDDDAWFPAGTIKRMIRVLREYPGIALLCGSFCNRLPYANILAWKDIDDARSYVRLSQECPMGTVVEVQSCGAHFLVHRIDLLETLGPEPWNKYPEHDESEDVAFCRRVRENGLRIGCDTGSIVAHIDPRDGAAYIPSEPAAKILDNAFVRQSMEHMAPKTTEEREYAVLDVGK